MIPVRPRLLHVNESSIRFQLRLVVCRDGGAHPLVRTPLRLARLLLLDDCPRGRPAVARAAALWPTTLCPLGRGPSGLRARGWCRSRFVNLCRRRCLRRCAFGTAQALDTPHAQQEGGNRIALVTLNLDCAAMRLPTRAESALQGLGESLHVAGYVLESCGNFVPFGLVHVEG